MDKMIQRTIKSKTLKVFLIAIVLVFSYEVNKPKALAPLAFAGAILAGMAAETMVTMGVKAVSKAVLKTQAKNYSDNMALQGKFDWTDLNPYRNKDGSITLSPTANDRAKMAGLISGGLVGSMFGESMGGNVTAPACLPERLETLGYSGVPFKLRTDVYNTLSPADRAYYYDETARAGNMVYSTLKYNDAIKQYVISLVNVSTGVHLWDYNIPVNTDYTKYVVSIGGVSGAYYTYGVFFESPVDVFAQKAVVNIPAETFNTIKNDFDAAKSAGENIYLCDDMYIPSTIDNVYPAPMDMSSTYKLPNHDALANKPFTIYNVFAPSTTEGEVTWEELEERFADDPTEFDRIMDTNIDTYLARGDIDENDYTIEEINNYYTDVNYPVKVGDINPDLETGIEPVPDTGDVAPINRSMLQVMKESYQFLADGIDNSVASMKTVTDGATGLINYLDGAFRWLPAEWRAMFGAAFVLGVFAHFFRR